MDKVEYYDKFAQKYITDDQFWSKYHGNRFHTFNSLLPPKGKAAVFDFGCGSGENVINLLRMGYYVTGCDISNKMIELAKTNLKREGFDNSILHVGGLESLRNLPDRSVDIMSSLNVLPYLTEDEEAFFYNESERIVKKNGYIIVSHTNMLVDLVTFNKYTVEFWKDNIIPQLTNDIHQQKELIRIFKLHLANPNIPRTNSAKRSERDFLKKRRENPITYPNELNDKYGLSVEEIAFTHYFPMPPQFMESSQKYRFYIYDFEERMKDNPLSYIFASIFILRIRNK